MKCPNCGAGTLRAASGSAWYECIDCGCCFTDDKGWRPNTVYVKERHHEITDEDEGGATAAAAEIDGHGQAGGEDSPAGEGAEHQDAEGDDGARSAGPEEIAPVLSEWTAPDPFAAADCDDGWFTIYDDAAWPNRVHLTPSTAGELINKLENWIISRGIYTRRSLAPSWDCGHTHPTRAEAVECKRRQAGAFC